MQLGQNWITALPRHKSHDQILCESTQTHGREEFKTQGFLGHYTSVLHFPFPVTHLRFQPVVRTQSISFILKVAFYTGF